MPSSEWYYVQDKQRCGPVSKKEIRDLYDNGTITGDDLVWTKGMSEWKPAGQVQARFLEHAAAAPAAVATAPRDEAGIDDAIDMEKPAQSPIGGIAIEPAAAYDVGEGLGIDRTYAPTTEHEYAGFGARLGAFLIDGFIVFVLNMLVMALSMGAMFMVGSLVINTSAAQGVMTMMVVGMWALLVAVPWLYYARQESGMKMATIGKRAVGIQVIDVDGYPISFLRATGRYFSKTLLSGIMLIGFLMALFTPKKQALHDMIAATLVVKGKQ